MAIALILVGAQAPLNRSLIAFFVVVSTALLGVAKALQRRWVERTHGRAVALVMGVRRGGRPGELEHLRGRQVEVLEDWTAGALRERLRAGGVDEVVVAPVVPRDVVPELVEAGEEVGVPVLVAAERLAAGIRPPTAEVVGRTLYLLYERKDLGGVALLMKAVLDRTLAALALAVTLPLMLLLAVLVKLTSRGPVLFVQPRGGLNGHSFPMLKFRTMRPGAEAERAALLAANEMDGPVFKIKNDPRVTGVGAFLRRTSLDELPQLANVVLGHMSLVGPRPLPLVETQALTGRDRRRLSMRPGITGLWQVSGRNDVRFEDWMALDLEYVDHWSLGLDLAILLRTVPALVSRRGAA
jgi:exopolysaccharide biosynthesis polyprenyl glycosylphosphotransferase